MFTLFSRKPKVATIVLKCRRCGTEKSRDVPLDLLSYFPATIYYNRCDCDKDDVNTDAIETALKISKDHRNITQNYGIAIEQLEIAVRELLKSYC